MQYDFKVVFGEGFPQLFLFLIGYIHDRCYNDGFGIVILVLYEVTEGANNFIRKFL